MYDSSMTENASNGSQGRRCSATLLLAIFVVALCTRAGFGILLFNAPNTAADLAYDDEFWYWSIAESYHDGHGLVGEFGHRAERMFLYPWFLSWFTGLAKGMMFARIAQWVLGAIAACLTCVLGSQVCRHGWIAGLIVACDPTLVGSASLLLTETIFVTCIAAVWCAGWPLRSSENNSNWRWVVLALLACASLHLRESSLFLILTFLGFLAVGSRDWKIAGRSAVVMLLMVLSLVPWAYRNNRAIGKWCWFTTRGGISLYDGVRPNASGASDLAMVKDAPELTGLTESEWDAHFREEAWKAIVADPWRVVRLVPIKLARTWNPVLNAGEYQARAVRLVFAAWNIPLCILVLAGLWSLRHRLQTALGLLLPAICICCLHSIFVGSVRYRLGALPALAVIAAVGAGAIVAHLKKPSCSSDER